MTGGSRLAAQALAKQFPWESYNTVIDIGTAQGCVPVEIAKAHPHLTGGGFDLPELQEEFAGYVRSHGLDRRLEFFPGNFFNDPLPSADVLNHGAKSCMIGVSPQRELLLKKAYKALRENGVLIVMNHSSTNSRRSLAHSLLASLNMLIQTDGGSEFTALECMTWMREAGFGETRLAVDWLSGSRHRNQGP